MNKLATKIAVGATAVATLAALALASTSMVSAATTNGAANSSTQGVQNGMMNWGNREQGETPRGPRMGVNMQNVQHTVANISNGVTVTLTSTDSATVTKLQSRPQPTPPANSNITVTQSNITNGIQITTTSTDAATVTKLQTEAQNGHGFGPGFGGLRGKHGGPGMMGLGMFDKNVTRNVQKITNGITITLTSTDAATVTKLQQLAGK